MTSRQNPYLQPVRSVLVVTKHNFMGDTIVAVPLLRAARRTFPEATIALLTGHRAKDALAGCPYVNHIECYDPRCRDFSSLKLGSRLRRVLGGRPDLCLIADRSFRSAQIALVAGGRARAGFDSEGRGFLLTHRVPYRPDAPEAECCLDILRVVAPEGQDEPPYDPAPELWATPAERERGAQILAEQGLHPGEAPIVGIQPGASYPAKQWRSDGFAEVADAVSAQGARVVLIGYGDREKEAAQALRQAAKGPQPVDMTGATGLRDTMGVLTHLSLFVGNDTGVNHIAASLGVPTVGLFGPTLAQKWGNVSPRNRVLAAPDGDLTRLEIRPVVDTACTLLSITTAGAGRNEPGGTPSAVRIPVPAVGAGR